MRRTIPWLAGGAAALALITVASCTSTPATAEPTPAPEETPTIRISARAESACGLITVHYLVPDDAEVTIYRAAVGGEAQEWVEVPELLSQGRDYPEPHGATYAYRVDADLDRDGEVDESVMSDEVTSHVCVTPSPSAEPSVDPTPAPSPSATASAEQTGAATATPSPTPTVPVEKDTEGGLAATGE